MEMNMGSGDYEINLADDDEEEEEEEGEREGDETGKMYFSNLSP